MKISFHDFLALSDQEQYVIIFTAGDFIEIRLDESRRFVLYAVDMFFVEVEYDCEKNKIRNKRAFVNGEILDKYSSSI